MNAKPYVAIGLLVASCTAAPPVVEIGSAPVCATSQQCESMWSAAKAFVERRASFKIEKATDLLIETADSTDYSYKLAMRVLKVSLGDGRYRLEATAWCASVIGCKPHPRTTVIAFNREIGPIR